MIAASPDSQLLTQRSPRFVFPAACASASPEPSGSEAWARARAVFASLDPLRHVNQYNSRANGKYTAPYLVYRVGAGAKDFRIARLDCLPTCPKDPHGYRQIMAIFPEGASPSDTLVAIYRDGECEFEWNAAMNYWQKVENAASAEASERSKPRKKRGIR